MKNFKELNLRELETINGGGNKFTRITIPTGNRYIVKKVIEKLKNIKTPKNYNYNYNSARFN